MHTQPNEYNIGPEARQMVRPASWPSFVRQARARRLAATRWHARIIPTLNPVGES